MRIPSAITKLSPVGALILFTAACATRGEPHLAQSYDGVSIEYEVAGEGDVTLLFVHGWSCDRSYWRKQISALARHYRVAAMDLAGHGASGFQREKWTIKNYGKDVVAVADALAARKIILVGHSMGGLVALEAARRLDERVVGIIGVDTLKEAADRPSREEAREFWRPLRDDFENQVMGIVPQLFFVAESDPDLVQAVARDMASAPPRVAVPSGISYSRYDEQRGLRRLRRLPVSLINSGYQPTDMNALTSVHPRVKVVTMEGIGHFPMLEDPQRFNTLLRAEVKTIVSPEPKPQDVAAD